MVLPADHQIIAEVKRQGLLHDTESTLEMRVGDELVLYLEIGE